MDVNSLIATLAGAGINTSKGLEFCLGNEDLYVELLREYVRGSEEKIDNTAKFLQEDNMKDYGTLVHSMKSTSKTIGADDVSESCLALEKAADEGDRDYIRQNHDRMIEDYKKLIALLVDAGIKAGSGSDDGDDDGVMEFAP
ncbi:MAG: Hpt domain-containing protein [Lachnospiraceae bacterium]|nr:Hpt domain-containing protein [Lachnospiraceae bacterium]